MADGFTLWFTGLSGAGKSTIAELVGGELEKNEQKVEYLDGDVVRTHLSKGLGFSKKDRDTNIERIGWVASRLTRHGAAVLVSAISPLEGFMGRDDYERVLEEMRLAKGLPWALPLCLAVDHEPQADEVALTDEAGKSYATLEVDEVYEYDKEREARNAFRTTDEAHPGVARLY